jgi:hypothetical protein
MLFKSAYADFQQIVRSEVINFHPATGVEIGKIPMLIANFGRHTGEYQTEDWLTGGTHDGAHIQGYFFDSNVAQEEKGWTDDEREAVEYSLQKTAKEQPYLVSLVEIEVIPAAKPWPSYDDQTAKQIVEVAAATDLVEQALAYERENKSRSTLIIELEQIALARHRAQQEAEQAKEMAEISL